MFVSEDGTVTGSVDVSRLGSVEPKGDEAKAQHEALMRDLRAGQEQAERDAERASQGERALGINSTGRDDSDAEARAEARAAQQRDAERQQAEADRRTQQQGDVEVKQLQAQAERAGVAVDKRWGADRLRQEIASSQAGSGKKA